jgi:5-methylcytosine-specific restriction endonuclease McrBC regulatory subunit McrC
MPSLRKPITQEKERQFMQTLMLTERQATRCSLSGVDLDFLLANHAKHLQIVPTHDNGVFVLRPTRLVGLIVAPTCRLVIRPKLPLRSFAFLLDADDDFQHYPGSAREFEVLDILTRRLIRLLGERLAAGLHQSDVELSDEGLFLQGRLDVGAQLREEPRRDRLHSLRQEQTRDVPCNQLVRSTLEMLGKTTMVSEVARASLLLAVAALAGISPIALTAELFCRVLADPAIISYRPLLELCQLVFESLKVAGTVGTANGAFLIDLERLFERYITRGIQNGFLGSAFRVEEQLLFRLAESTVQLRPDVLVRGGEEARLVIDAKWKRLRPGAVHPRDLYQLLAYGSVIGAQRLALIYPGQRDTCYGFQLVAGVEVRIYLLRVTAGRKACIRSQQRLGRSLRRWLELRRESRL